jgi:hypothetical protein
VWRLRNEEEHPGFRHSADTSLLIYPQCPRWLQLGSLSPPSLSTEPPAGGE